MKPWEWPSENIANGTSSIRVVFKLKHIEGFLISHWKKENEHFSMDVEIPANTTAKIYFPAKASDVIMESGKSLSTV